MSELHAVIALQGLDRLESYALHRAQIADRYRSALESLPGVSFQHIRPGCRTSHKDFPILVEATAFGLTRDELAEGLRAERIPTRAYFDPPGHRLSAHLCEPAPSLPVTDLICSRIICLPISSHMALTEVETICQAITNLHSHAAQVKAGLPRS